MLQHFRCRFVLVVIVTVLLAHCGGGGSDSGTPPPTTAIAKTGNNSGDAQNGSVGQPLGSPLQVLVTESGAPSAGTTVTWSTGVAGGSVVPAGVTDANGIASATWTLGNAAGSQTASAALTGASGSPVTFTATAAPGAPAALAKAGGDQQIGNVNTPLGDLLQAKVADQFGNGVPNIDVSWEAVGATVSAPVVSSGTTGLSQVQVTLGPTAGPVTVTAAAGGLAPITFDATAQVPAPIPTTASVGVGNIFFASNHNGSRNPAVDTVAAGGTVTWTWVRDGEHSVVSILTPSFTSSGTKSNAGDTHTATFATAGTYRYLCGIHGQAMTGTIVVR
jgi:plastocyanin